MCLPKQDPSAMPPTDIPSMQAASALQLGGSQAPRGSALLGRLKLRTGGTTPLPASTPKDSSQASSVLGFGQANQGSSPSGASSLGDLGFNGGVPNLDLNIRPAS